MTLRIKYFGLIAETTMCEAESIDFYGTHVFELLNILYITYPSLKDKDFQVAQNQELVSIESKINGTEIALLPPFTGG